MGKGCKPRPVDIKKYRGNWDDINWTSKPKFSSPDAPNTPQEFYDKVLTPIHKEVVEVIKNDIKKDFFTQATDAIQSDVDEVVKQDLIRAMAKIIANETPIVIKTPIGKAKRYVYR